MSIPVMLGVGALESWLGGWGIVLGVLICGLAVIAFVRWDQDPDD